jgi:hypothetical protein
VTDCPPPMTPPDCDLRDFSHMMLDITRLHQSDFDSIENDSAWRAGVNLWLSAFHSVPAGSLANSDASLAKAAGLGRDVRRWKRLRDDALRGFELCSDNRLYHRVVAATALDAWLGKLEQRRRSIAGGAKKHQRTPDTFEVDAQIRCAEELLGRLEPDRLRRRQCRRQRMGNAQGTAQGKGGEA